MTDAPGLTFGGLQAYQGAAQLIADPAERAGAIAASLDRTRAARDAILSAGLPCLTVSGAGTGSFALEAASGLYTELQCGSYAFMDAHYARVLNTEGFEHALFILTSVLSKTHPGKAVCDAGLKVTTTESGLPRAQPWQASLTPPPRTNTARWMTQMTACASVIACA